MRSSFHLHCTIQLAGLDPCTDIHTVLPYTTLLLPEESAAAAHTSNLSLFHSVCPFFFIYTKSPVSVLEQKACRFFSVVLVSTLNLKLQASPSVFTRKQEKGGESEDVRGRKCRAGTFLMGEYTWSTSSETALAWLSFQCDSFFDKPQQVKTFCCVTSVMLQEKNKKNTTAFSSTQWRWRSH